MLLFATAAIFLVIGFSVGVLLTLSVLDAWEDA